MTDQGGRILGIDYGTKRVGLSISDPLCIIAQGVGTFQNDDRLLERLQQIIREREVERIVVGMPYGPDGGKSAKGLEVETFIERLRGITNLRIETWDESHSSVNAQRVFIEGGMKKKRRQEKSRLDEMAARIMLQEYLDHSEAR